MSTSASPATRSPPATAQAADAASTARAGVLAGIGSYTIWGLFPLYLKHLGEVPALELVAHRSAWSLLLLALLLVGLRRLAWLRTLLGRPKVVAGFAASALLLAANWLLYVWAVAHDRVLDASLGYFINPLVNVVLGYAVLHERPRRLQWAAIALAAGGVLWLALGSAHMPWVSLGLGFSFGVYGLLRKTAPLGPLEGLTLETLIQAPLAIGWLAWLASTGDGHFARGDGLTDLLLVVSGPLTAAPLLLFAAAARRIRLATLGLLQYLSPSLQFGLGVLLYHEPFDARRAVGFVLIWTALAVYSLESWRALRAGR